MNKTIKIVGVGCLTLAGLVAALAYTASALADHKAHRIVSVAAAGVAFASGEASVRRGRYLFESRGCMHCHGADGGGRTFIDDPNGLYVKSPDITSSGVVQDYTERDWERAVRHGVKPSGEPLLIMPSADFNRLTDEDLAAVVAYVRSLPPASGTGAQIRLPLIVKALYAVGVVQDAAEKIDHSLPPPQPIPAAATAQYGAYVANSCIGCHGASLSGGKIPGGPPSWPAAANLTPGSESVMPRYDTPEKFVAMMHSGQRPDGSAVSRVMPFETLAVMSETDLRAVYAYLGTLAPRAHGR
jgi:mono/diheme cytochrome c family protein